MARRALTVTITGGSEIERKLNRLENAVQREIMAKALLAAAEPVRSDASRRAPRRTGFLAEHIEKAPGKEENTVVVGPSPDAFYGRFSEFGTSKQPARPWLRPALDSQKNAAEASAAAVLRAGIEREV